LTTLYCVVLHSGTYNNHIIPPEPREYNMGFLKSLGLTLVAAGLTRGVCKIMALRHEHRKYYSRKLNDADEQVGASILYKMDIEDLGDPDDILAEDLSEDARDDHRLVADLHPLTSHKLRRVRKQRTLQYSIRVAGEVKASIGVLSRTEANRLVVQKCIIEKMKAHKVREHDMQALLSVAVECFFIPNQGEILAAKMRSMATVVDRCDKIKEWEVVKPGCGWLGGLWWWMVGRKVSHPLRYQK
jgi:hypothetical protein